MRQDHEGVACRRGWKCVLGVVLASVTLAGCSPLTKPMIGPYPATVSEMSVQARNLRMLPPPTRRIPVAVYDMPDLTGQYREREDIQSLSRAVTQGAAPMLIETLQDAGQSSWFSVLDRSNLDDLLRERQIVTEMRRIYRGEETPDPVAVPPLRHAGIIVQGAIVGYDSNTQTGGFGARYLGIGSNTRWKLDIVTVSLRAVSSGTGEVLASVTVEKPIASTSLNGGVFSYIALDELLEIETGVAANEPKQLAVRRAIEKAVYSLILEGAERGIWNFSDNAAGRRLLAQHRAETYRGNGAAVAHVPLRRPDAITAIQVVETRPGPRAQPQRQAQQRVAPVGPAPAEPVTPPPPPPADESEILGATTLEGAEA